MLDMRSSLPAALTHTAVHLLCNTRPSSWLVGQEAAGSSGSAATTHHPVPAAAESSREAVTGPSLGLPPLKPNPARKLARRSQSSATSEITPVDEDAPLEVCVRPFYLNCTDPRDVPRSFCFALVV